MITQELYTPEQAAVVIGVTTRTVYSMIDRGILTTKTLPATTPGRKGHRRITRASIEKIVNGEE